MILHCFPHGCHNAGVLEHFSSRAHKILIRCVLCVRLANWACRSVPHADWLVHCSISQHLYDKMYTTKCIHITLAFLWCVRVRKSFSVEVIFVRNQSRLKWVKTTFHSLFLLFVLIHWRELTERRISSSDMSWFFFFNSLHPLSITPLFATTVSTL